MKQNVFFYTHYSLILDLCTLTVYIYPTVTSLKDIVSDLATLAISLGYLHIFFSIILLHKLKQGIAPINRSTRKSTTHKGRLGGFLQQHRNPAPVESELVTELSSVRLPEGRLEEIVVGENRAHDLERAAVRMDSVALFQDDSDDENA